MGLEGEKKLWICDWFDRCLVSCDKVVERAVIKTGNANIHFGKEKTKIKKKSKMENFCSIKWLSTNEG